MMPYLTRRLLGGLVTIGLSTVVIFSAVRFVPGDPLTARLAEGRLSEESAASLRRIYGLDRPLPAQYGAWIGAVAQGDLGRSLTTQGEVMPEVARRIPRTLVLAVGGLMVAVAVGVPAGMVGARYRRRWPDYLVVSGNTVLLALPIFFTGMVLIVALAVTLRWFPVGGFVDPRADTVGWLRALVLPSLTIGLPASAFIARVMRSSLVDALNQEFVRTAEARGLSPARILLRHALKNAAIPTLTVVGLQLGALLGGAIITEVLFTYPGMGSLLVDAIGRRDYPVVQAALLFFAVAFVLVNLLIDLLYTVVDPRLRR